MPDALPVPARLRPRALTAAAQAYTPVEYRAGGLWHAQSWQAEGWGFFDTLGEFSEAVDWQARAMSRIRLVAAEITPTGPEVLEEGPAADLMAAFCGGTPGHAAFLAAITPHLKVPGEGWLIAERQDPTTPLAAASWTVYPIESIQARGNVWWVQIGDSIWRPLAEDALPMRIYQPHPRRPWLATSSAQAAIPIMRRIDLIDRRIIAMMVSRLAMNGLLLIPQEGTFTVPPQYQDAPDPFVAMLIDIAGKNMADPGRATAGIPIPVKFAADYIEKWRILKPDDPLDEWLLKERTDELGRLGDALSIARERVTGGMSNQNHWNLWGISEEEIRLSFDPAAELIAGAVTKSYLQPALRASGLSATGPNGGLLICWYDDSLLAARTDLSAAALNLYNAGELSGVALRRESGFTESDAPDPAELAGWAWRKVLTDPNLAAEALKQLIGAVVSPPTPTVPVAGNALPGPAATPTPPTISGVPAKPATGPPQQPANNPPPALSSSALRRPVAITVNGHVEEPVANGRR